MARKARVEYPGAVYHVLDRGDRRESIFCDDADRKLFLATLTQACRRAGWRVHAWVLMSNHYHLLLETPEANLVAGMRWMQTTYTVRFNRRHRLCGHLFQGRYKSLVVEAGAGNYFAVLSDYIHLNPVRAFLVRPEDRLVDYRWSSYPAYVTGRERPEWLEVSRVFGEVGVEDTSEGRRRYAQRMRERAVATLSGEDGAELARLRRGWCLGGESFRERMLSLLGAATGFCEIKGDVPSESRSHGEARAREMIEAGLAHFGLRTEDLADLPKGDPRKLAIATVVRGHSAVSNRWLAEALRLGHASRLSHATMREPGVVQMAKKLAKKLESKH